MNALVCGGGGFIGSHLVDRLGSDTVVIDPREHGNAIDLGCTIQQTPYLRSRPSVIYHLASPVGPVGVIEWAGKLVEEVIETTAIVRRWALWAKCPLVYVSTSEIYGPQPEGETPETAPRITAAGHSARMEYAVAKLAAETMLLNTPDLDVRIIRPFNVAGPRQRAELGFVLPRFIAQAKAGEPLTVYGDGGARRAFTHVHDIVDGIIRAATKGYAGGIWNLGNPANACSIRTLAAEVILELRSTSTIDCIDPVSLWGAGFHEAPDKVPDITKARTELGWNPSRDRRQVIRDAAGRAAGGPINGSTYLVGEHGPERIRVG